MIIELTFGLWIVPVLITILTLCWALFYIKDTPGYMSGLNNILALIPALFISCLAWAIYGLCK